MNPTVHELRNEIRTSVGRFEREVDAQFTKEELAAVADALGADVGEERSSKETMRGAIREQTDGSGDNPGTGTFTKSDLEAIVEVLDEG